MLNKLFNLNFYLSTTKAETKLIYHFSIYKHSRLTNITSHKDYLFILDVNPCSFNIESCVSLSKHALLFLVCLQSATFSIADFRKGLNFLFPCDYHPYDSTFVA